MPSQESVVRKYISNIQDICLKLGMYPGYVITRLGSREDGIYTGTMDSK